MTTSLQHAYSWLSTGTSRAGSRSTTLPQRSSSRILDEFKEHLQIEPDDLPSYEEIDKFSVTTVLLKTFLSLNRHPNHLQDT